VNDALSFIVGTIFDIVCFLFLARFILQACRADFYNPISQGIVKATDPVLKPLRVVIPAFRNLDFAAFLVAWVVKVVGYAILIALTSSYLQGVFSLMVLGLYEVVRLLLTIYWFAIIIIVILSFIAPGNYHPAIELLRQVTEPILGPARKLIPPLGGLDFSPIIVFMLLVLIRDHLLPVLFQGLLS
jgi:YggT family protein